MAETTEKSAPDAVATEAAAAGAVVAGAATEGAVTTRVKTPDPKTLRAATTGLQQERRCYGQGKQRRRVQERHCFYCFRSFRRSFCR